MMLEQSYIRTLDQCGANIRAEEALNAELKPLVRCRMVCEVHITSVIQKFAYYPIGSAIAGMISSSLAMRPVGAFHKLRQAVAHVLSTADFVHAIAPSVTDPRSMHTNALLDLLLPAASQATRRDILRRDLNGDWSAMHC